ncbi:MAG: PhnD/SsuA/transferrin family substrate-binding protein, partial [Treponema porcinum]|nr:PhnD/SsuA/transferrin family substrate-binding protein [Treponema porcinum]
MTKKTCVFFSVIFFASHFVISEPSRIGYVKGMTAVPFVYMMPETDKFEFIEFSGVSALVEGMKNGEIDAANLPVNAAVSLYEKTSGAVVCIAVTQNINYSVISPAESNVSSLSDLVGKKLLYSGNGFTSGFIFWILERNDIPSGQGENVIQLERIESETAAVTHLSNGTADAAILSEPAASASLSVNKKFRRSVDLQDAYTSINGSRKSVPVTVLVARTQFAEKSYDSLLLVVQHLENSVSRIQRSPLKAAASVKKYSLGIQPAVSGNAVSR